MDLLAKLVAGASRYFGNCLVVPEVNNTGFALVNALLKLGVPVYKRAVLNQQTKSAERQYGWRTDIQTRKTIIDELAAAVRDEELDCTPPFRGDDDVRDRLERPS